MIGYSKNFKFVHFLYELQVMAEKGEFMYFGSICVQFHDKNQFKFSFLGKAFFDYDKEKFAFEAKV